MAFADLKKNRKSMIDKLIDAGEKARGSAAQQSDDKFRFWSPTLDKVGNGFAVIRFLPSADSAGLPWAQYYDHGFKGPTGRWYIEKSLTTIGQDDPVSQVNSYFWNRGDEKGKDIARSRKRRLHYVSNILVISDNANPDNEGKVFLYKYGKKIFEKIMDIMQPQFEDETPINPFDLWEGADFKLKIRQVDGYRNYDKSEFAEASALFDGDDKKLKELFEQLHHFDEWTDVKNYKPYSELYRKLCDVIGTSVVEEAIGNMSNEPTAESKLKSPSKPAPRDEDDDLNYDMNSSSDEAKIEKSSGDDDESDEDDDEMNDYFKQLAEED